MARAGVSPDAAAVAERVAASPAVLERILVGNVIPFWHPRVVDDAGGYHLNHDGRGESLGPGPKGVVAQTWVLWYFSRLARSRWAQPHDAAAAGHGFRFLVDRYWDPVAKGLYWELPPSGSGAGEPRRQKEALGQAYGLLALVELVRTTGDPSAAELLAELWQVFDAGCHDDRFGGYVEVRNPDWSAATELRGAFTVEPGAKTLGVQLHVLEALVPLAECGLVTEPDPGERLRELVHLLVATWGGTAVRPGHSYFRDDWGFRDRAGARERRYGHDVELLWILIDASRCVGIPAGDLQPFFVDAMDDVLRYGFDHRHGGFYRAGHVGRAAHATEKDYWAQAEGLLAALRMYELTGEARYGECFLRTVDWIDRHQADWEHGDWHERIDRRGRPDGVKAWGWKDPYHQARALIECIETIEGTRIEGMSIGRTG